MIRGFNCDSPANKATWLAKNKDNEAQSCWLGIMMMMGSRTCYGMTGLTAYKCTAGVKHFFVNIAIKADDFRMVECKSGIALFSNGPQEKHTVNIQDMAFVSLARPDCPSCYANGKECSW
jgi:hypothetical protein